MQAVIQSGAHQYRVKVGDAITVDKIKGKIGDTVTFDKVLLVGDKVGAEVGKATVKADITEQKTDPKITVFKYRRRKNSKKKRGHKQPVTVVSITKIA